MKKLSTILLATTLLVASHIDEFAQRMGYAQDYATALERAKKENKPLMMLMVSKRCKWCKKFEKRTLQMIPVAVAVQKHYIPLIVDRADRARYPDGYYSRRIPIVYFIDPHTEEQTYESIGYVGYKEFLQILRDEYAEFIAQEGER